jgi:alkaline phosphatase
MLHKSLKFFVFLLALVIITTSSVASTPEMPKNIIVMIGDGMGVAQITATELERYELNLRRFKKIGLKTTTAADKLVTDSAAAATALATGYKTIEGRLGMDKNKKILKNVFDYALENKMGRGVVVTSTFNHATPAGFTIHAEKRYDYDIIAERIVDADLDVIFAGGMCNLLPKSMKGSKRKDNKNLLLKLRKQMPVVQSIDTFRRLGTPRKAAAILASVHLPLASNRNYSLGELTSKALKILNRNENGFILMVEGSQIDLQGHKHNYDNILDETVDFDTAVKEALDFAEKDGDTLVVVTADHETGGLTLIGGTPEENKFEYHFSTGHHSATMVAVYSYGPGSEHFMGTYDNTYFGKTLIKLLKR